MIIIIKYLEASMSPRPPATAIAVTLQGPMRSLAGPARRLEAAGADSVWTGDYFQSGLVRVAVLGSVPTAGPGALAAWSCGETPPSVLDEFLDFPMPDRRD